MAEQKKAGNVSVAVRPKYRVLDPDEAPKVAHLINFHRVGSDIVMSIGRLDIMALATEIEEKKFGEELSREEPIEVEAEVRVFEQIAMSPNTFATLVTGAQNILNAMVESGEMRMKPAGDDNVEEHG